MYICPVCNGIVDYIAICSNCKNEMKILDKVEYYRDEYAVNLEQNTLETITMSVCEHYCYCEGCNKTIVIKVDKVNE